MSRCVDEMREGFGHFSTPSSDFEQGKDAFIRPQKIKIKARSVSWAEGVGKIMFGWVTASTVVGERHLDRCK
jgi:hypothetical protein